METADELIPQGELKAVREELGLNPTELENKMMEAGVNINRNAITSYERGETTPVNQVRYYEYVSELARLRKEGLASRAVREIQHTETANVARQIQSTLTMVSHYVKTVATGAPLADVRQLASAMESIQKSLKTEGALLAGMVHKRQQEANRKNR